MTATLCWAALKVIRLAKRSVDMHKNPGYMLYSDPKCLNRWGFLYVQYRATAYYFIIPLLAYILVKAMFIAFAQHAPVVQAVALVIIEAVFLIGASVLRPWMDKKTNIFNISIAAINLLNGLFLLVFTTVFGQPGIVTGVMGVIFFIYNAVFALVLLILVLIASIYAIASKNPDTRYQPMRDDRGSFIKSNPKLTTELDALGATARGDMKAPYGKSRLDDDEESFSSGSLGRHQNDASNVPLPPSTANSAYQRGTSERHSPVDNQPMFPADHAGRRGPPTNYDQRGTYNQAYNGSEYSQGYERSQDHSPQPYNGGAGYPSNESSYPPPPHQYRQ
jgi:Transient receptor potential (TRP) ion channel